jgi:hypothetical protein
MVPLEPTGLFRAGELPNGENLPVANAEAEKQIE